MRSIIPWVVCVGGALTAATESHAQSYALKMLKPNAAGVAGTGLQSDNYWFHALTGMPYVRQAAVIGIGACVFVQDFLAVRGLAVVLLLLAKVMVDTGRPHLGETPWVLLIQTWAYVLVLAGIWFTISPWRLRDLLNWATATEQRVKVGSAIRLAFALLVVTLGLTAFRAM